MMFLMSGIFLRLTPKMYNTVKLEEIGTITYWAITGKDPNIEEYCSDCGKRLQYLQDKANILFWSKNKVGMFKSKVVCDKCLEEYKT